MPIPIYTALNVEVATVLGGSTMPSLMSVKDQHGSIQEPYIVKVFKQKNTEQYQPTNKECYCHLLAREFDLPVPDAALVYVDDYIIRQLQSNRQYATDIVPGYYFGTRYHADVSLFQAGISDDMVEEAATIFAFDVFIRNMDRNIGKPNLLIWKEGALLIDHELALDIQKSFTAYWALNGWQVFSENTKSRHIFFEKLCRVHQTQALQFDSFLEYLHRINLHPLQQCNQLLKDCGHPSPNFEQIIAYLEEIKKSPLAFRTLLQNLLASC